jgi:hypothetical protein
MVSGILDDLVAEFGGEPSESVVRAYLVRAISDLRGSISQEALPEMAVRLARVRLTADTVDASLVDDPMVG